MSAGTAGATRARRGWSIERVRPHAAPLGLVLLLAFGAVLYFVAGRGLSFFFDEWTFILQRRSNDADAFLSPHNGHLSLIPVAIYKTFWAIVGLRHYGPYRLVEVALHLTCVALLFVLVRRRVSTPAAFLAAASLLCLGRAWQDLVWPFQISYLGSLAAGLGMLLALERDDRTGDLLAALLLSVSLACSGIGLAFAVGAVTALVMARSSRQRYLVAVVPPLALYAVWYVFYGESQARASNVTAIPSYVFESFAAALGAICGLDMRAGKVAAVIAVLGLLAAIMGRRRLHSAAVPAAIVLSFWVATALTRAHFHEPEASRYLYPGGLLLLLLTAELVSGLRLGPVVIGVLAVGVIAASFSNLRVLRDGAAGLRDTSATVDAELGIVELEAAVVSPNFRPDSSRAPQITAGPYLAAVADLGSPALPAAELIGQSPSIRAEADAVLVRAVASVLVSRGTAPTASTPPVVEGYRGGSLVRHRGCIDFRVKTSQAPASLDIVLPVHGVVVWQGGTSSVFLRRFADTFPEDASLAVRARAWILRPPLDASRTRWRARFAPSSITTVCGAR
jgi:hypothetical protein